MYTESWCIKASHKDTMKIFKKLIKSKALYLAAALLFQLLILVLLVTYFSHEFLPMYYLMVALSVVASILVINRDSDTSSKLLWVFVIMAMPFFGGLMYLLFGGRKIPKALMVQDRQAYADYKRYAKQNLTNLQATETNDPVLSKMTYMAWNNGYFPVYANEGMEYYPTGQDQFEAMMEALEQAREYIFIETYIIDEGQMLTRLTELLERKAKEGVDVRMIYDDFGSILNLKPEFCDEMAKKGIACRRFNPIRPQLAIQMNNRDHRKSVIIDGKTAFTGGSNIADEYINLKERFGYWKDMGVKVTGDAVEAFVIAFLQIWNYSSDVNTPYEDFVRSSFHPNPDVSKGLVLPFFDSPTDENDVGKNFHLNMLSSANKFCWISTPYLILDAEMISALELAVKNGVDVRVIVPGIPDKKMVYEVTKANTEILVNKGVKVYEYEPGFIHGKVTVTDGKHALAGTVNMDFRSYYFNYECGIWMYQTECIQDIQKDMEEIFEKSHLVTVEECKKTNPMVRLMRNTLKIFSPLL